MTAFPVRDEGERNEEMIKSWLNIVVRRHLSLSLREKSHYNSTTSTRFASDDFCCQPRPDINSTRHNRNLIMQIQRMMMMISSPGQHKLPPVQHSLGVPSSLAAVAGPFPKFNLKFSIISFIVYRQEDPTGQISSSQVTLLANQVNPQPN